MKILLVFSIFLVCVLAVGRDVPTVDYEIKTPTKLLEDEHLPFFADDLNFKDMNLAIQHQLAAFKRNPLKGTITFGDKTYHLSVLKETLLIFKGLVDRYEECLKTEMKINCVASFNTAIKLNFDLYVPVDPTKVEEEVDLRLRKKVHFTAYYSPIFDAKKEKDEEYAYPIYKLPSDDSLRRLTRESIDFDHKLEGHGLELYYVKDIFGLYLMHIEGGGAVKLVGDKNDQIRYLSYAGHNSNKFSFISKYMVKNGMIEDHAVIKQRRYLEEHPEQWREIFSYCKGYIYFQETPSVPLGLEDIPLTDNRSIAQDKKYYPRKGILSFVLADRPILQNGDIRMVPMRRFYIDQDTGGAIKGEARADIYFGFGDDAELAANHLNTYGDMLFLVTKNPSTGTVQK